MPDSGKARKGLAVFCCYLVLSLDLAVAFRHSADPASDPTAAPSCARLSARFERLFNEFSHTASSWAELTDAANGTLPQPREQMSAVMQLRRLLNALSLAQRRDCNFIRGQNGLQEEDAAMLAQRLARMSPCYDSSLELYSSAAVWPEAEQWDVKLAAMNLLLSPNCTAAVANTTALRVADAVDDELEVDQLLEELSGEQPVLKGTSLAEFANQKPRRRRSAPTLEAMLRPGARVTIRCRWILDVCNKAMERPNWPFERPNLLERVPLGYRNGTVRERVPDRKRVATFGWRKGYWKIDLDDQLGEVELRDDRFFMLDENGTALMGHRKPSKRFIGVSSVVAAPFAITALGLGIWSAVYMAFPLLAVGIILSVVVLPLILGSACYATGIAVIPFSAIFCAFRAALRAVLGQPQTPAACPWLGYLPRCGDAVRALDWVWCWGSQNRQSNFKACMGYNASAVHSYEGRRRRTNMTTALDPRQIRQLSRPRNKTEALVQR